jgi:glucuronate isomerase
MKEFLDENFILQNETAQKLYHDHAKKLPIIDYHCHISPKDIADDRKFDNLTRIWLEGDHYKWRAMRANGIDEEYITGKASDFEKFQKWAETVPSVMRNPLYHWTHMELLRPFGVKKILKPETAKEIYDECTAKLQTPEFSVRGIIRQMNVEVVCTTDDPVDTLEYHQKIKKDGFEKKVLPAWRPDKAMAVENPESFNAYMAQLEKAANLPITNFTELLDALKVRHDYFAKNGCSVSDHGLETFYAEDFKESEIKLIFLKVRGGRKLDKEEILKFKSAMLYHFAVLDAEKGWAQQFHIGAIRNNNSKMMRKLGPDTGYDAIGDFEIARPMSKFFDRLDAENKLTQTIVYNLNPRDNELMVTLALAYSDGKIPGKMQFGSGWWFLDQKDGMEKQLTALSNLGLLSRFVGMLTDSRSFLSYMRHDYFRRILCNMLGRDVENGELPASEIKVIEKMVEDISYYNAKNYFGF